MRYAHIQQFFFHLFKGKKNRRGKNMTVNLKNETKLGQELKKKKKCNKIARKQTEYSSSTTTHNKNKYAIYFRLREQLSKTR